MIEKTLVKHSETFLLKIVLRNTESVMKDESFSYIMR